MVSLVALETFNIALLLLYHFSLVSHFQPKQPNSEILCSNRSTINFKKTEKTLILLIFFSCVRPFFELIVATALIFPSFWRRVHASCILHRAKKNYQKYNVSHDGCVVAIVWVCARKIIIKNRNKYDEFTQIKQ